MAQPMWESIKVTGSQVVERAKAIVHEGNVRQIAVKQKDSVVAVFPLTVGVVGAVVAPVLAAVGALTALLTDCSIEIERRVTPAPRSLATRPPAEKPAARRRSQKG
jgi:hypothetical protein